MAVAKRKPARCEIFILAGGLSTRMGRDKSRVRLGPRTLLEHVRQSAEKTGLRVRVIRRDAVPRNGPIGGIYTGLQRSRADFVLFLACDMPFVRAELLSKMIKMVQTHKSPSKALAIFATKGRRVGFPILLHREAAIPIVSRQIEAGEFSLQTLAKKLHAKKFRFATGELVNINTPAELMRINKKFPR